MRAEEFLRRRREDWDRLEQLLTRAGGMPLKQLSEDEILEMVRRYPAAAVDAGRARLFGLDRRTQERINNLAIRTHGIVYLKPRRRILRRVIDFYATGFPRLFRRLYVYVLLSSALFLLSGTGAYMATRVKPSSAGLFMPCCIDLSDTKPGLSAADISERFRAIPKPPLATGVTANNISVAFNAFAMGILAGLGTAYILVFNGMMMGGIIAHFANHGLQFELFSFITAHGVLEIFAILLAGAAGLRLGLSFMMPGQRTRSASLKHGAREAVLLVLGTVPFFIVAGMLEGYMTPSFLPGAVKIGTGAAVWICALLYLLLIGRRPDAVAETRGS